MNDEERFQELKEKEIIRLTTPVTYKKVRFGADEAYDCEGNRIREFKDEMPILEPKKGLLSDDEILKYAPYSEEASRIRLKEGTGDFRDKWKIYAVYLFIIGLFGFYAVFFGFMYSIYVGFLILILIVALVIYLFFIRDLRNTNKKKSIEGVHNNTYIEDQKVSTNDDLLLLFEAKEKIAREMIERRFPAPQMTNTKFHAVLDNCKDVVESQIEILNAITPTEKTKYEISSRKKLIKQLIGKVDDLTNELILSEENNMEEVIEDMDNLINSVKEYN